MKRHIFLTILLLYLILPRIVSASSLTLSPSGGSYVVGSTFNVAILLDTKGKSINALRVSLSFPSDKLQIVSPSTGKSIIDVWTLPPKYNNIDGTITLEGGIPGGIIVSKGILTTLTFRVKAVGDAIIKFQAASRVFLDDGLATDDLSQLGNGVYQFKLPAPQGPEVISDTHPDQGSWYPDSTASLHFANEVGGIEAYSYVLSDEPETVPDNISEGIKQEVTYSNLADGIHYFHIKALRAGAWGGVTHFAIKVDTTPPADFPIEILPRAHTTSTKPIISFLTTDSTSGLDHYEIKLEPLSKNSVDTYKDSSSFFIETASPFITSPLAVGSYDVTLRAFDKAGNMREVSKNLAITTPLFKFLTDDGILIGKFTLPWMWVWLILLPILFGLLFLGYKAWQMHVKVHHLLSHKELPEDIVKQLEELKDYRQKYGVKILIALFVFLSLLSFRSVNAEINLAPPLITTYSKDISNKEIFYIGGKSNLTEQTVILYLQNSGTGETLSQTVKSDDNGEWFYRHNGFLTAGDYVLWTQGEDGGQMSPPSPQVSMRVTRTAVEFGANRLSFETIYLSIVIILLLLFIGLILFIIFHTYHGRQKHRKLKKEIRDIEESVRKGFAVLRRDIEAELLFVQKSRENNIISPEERTRENELMHDLNTVGARIGREIEFLEKEM